jgi:hemerythrin
MLRFLADWLTVHIDNSDRPMAAFLGSLENRPGT